MAALPLCVHALISKEGRQVHEQSRFDLNTAGAQGTRVCIGRRVLSHEWEARRAQLTAAAPEPKAEAGSLKQQWSAGAVEWLRVREQERQAENARQDKKLLPVWPSSFTDPLGVRQQPEGDGPAGTAASTAARTMRRAAASPQLRGHLALGSLVPAAAAESSAPASKPRPLVQQETELQENMQLVLAELHKEYPAGIPRKMILDLQLLGYLDTPAHVGYGFPGAIGC